MLINIGYFKNHSEFLKTIWLSFKKWAELKKAEIICWCCLTCLQQDPITSERDQQICSGLILGRTIHQYMFSFLHRRLKVLSMFNTLVSTTMYTVNVYSIGCIYTVTSMPCHHQRHVCMCPGLDVMGRSRTKQCYTTYSLYTRDWKTNVCYLLAVVSLLEYIQLT